MTRLAVVSVLAVITSFQAPVSALTLGQPRAAANAVGLQIASRNGAESECSQILPPSVLFLGMRTTQLSNLARMLQAHPELSQGSRQHHDFLTVSDATHDGNRRTLAQYFSEFEVGCDVKRTFDASAGQVMLGDGPVSSRCSDCIWFEFDRTHHNSIAEPTGVENVRKVRDMLGNGTKFLVMIRHPLKVALALKEWKPVEYGWAYCEEYVGGLQAWMSVFPRRNFMFLRYADFLRSPEQHLQKIFLFLGVSEGAIASITPPTSAEAQISVSPELVEAFDMQNQGCRHRLEDLTLLDMDWGAGHSQSAF